MHAHFAITSHFEIKKCPIFLPLSYNVLMIVPFEFHYDLKTVRPVQVSFSFLLSLQVPTSVKIRQQLPFSNTMLCNTRLFYVFLTLSGESSNCLSVMLNSNQKFRKISFENKKKCNFTKFSTKVIQVKFYSKILVKFSIKVKLHK